MAARNHPQPPRRRRASPWRSCLPILSSFACFAVVVLATPSWGQIELGHKTLGTIGLDAGSQPERGIYLAERFLEYGSEVLVDRNGQTLPVGLDLRALANGIGIAAVFEIEPVSTYVTLALAAPLAAVDVSTERPEASIDRFGLGDVYIQPLRLGWRLPRLDVVVGYGLYVPTGRQTPGGTGGVSRGHFTHQPSLGGTLFFDGARTFRLSALASYDINTEKIGVDVTRGQTAQVQGGIGKTIIPGVDLGIAFYGLAQTTGDDGDDLPDVLREARDFAFGLGPEVMVTLPMPRGRVGIRYERDVVVRSRTLGEIFVLSATFVVP